jgi:hypothetical protein
LTRGKQIEVNSYVLDRPSTILNSSEFYNELTNLLITDANKESLETLSNLLLPITKLDATACKGKQKKLKF